MQRSAGPFIVMLLETASVFVIYLAWRSITEGMPRTRCISSVFDASLIDYWAEDEYYPN